MALGGLRRPQFHKGQYGSALGSYAPAAQLLAQAGHTQGAAMAGLGGNIAGAIEKYQLNKQKRAKLTGEIEAMLPKYTNDLTMTGDETTDKKNQSDVDKFVSGEMGIARLEGFAGKLARMEKQKNTESAQRLEAAKSAYYEGGGARTAVDPEKAMRAKFLEGIMNRRNAHGAAVAPEVRLAPPAPRAPRATSLRYKGSMIGECVLM